MLKWTTTTTTTTTTTKVNYEHVFHSFSYVEPTNEEIISSLLIPNEECGSANRTNCFNALKHVTGKLMDSRIRRAVLLLRIKKGCF